MNKGFVKVWYLFLTCLFLGEVQGQDVYLRSYSTPEGLPSPTIYAMVSDRSGYIWFTTEAGPVRFDGENFWSPVQQHAHNKPGAMLVEDRLGRIWYESFDGYLFYIQGDTVRSISQTSPLGYISFLANPHHITFVTPQGLEKIPLDQLNRRFRISIAGFSPDHLFQSGDTTIALQDGRFIYSVIQDKAYRRQLSYSLYEKAPIFADGISGSVYVTSKFSSPTRAIYTVNSQGASLVCYLPFSQAIQSFRYHQGNFWIGTSQGIIVVSKTGKIRWNIPGLNVTAIYHHPNGIVWIGTRNQGVFRLDDLHMKSQTLPEGEFPMTLSIHGSQVVVGTEQGGLWSVSPSFSQKPKKVFQTQHEISWIEPIGPQKSVLGADQLFVLDDEYRIRKRAFLAAKDVVDLGQEKLGIAATGLFGYFHLDKKTSSDSSLTIDEFDGKWMTHVRGKWLVRDSLNNELYFAGNMGLFALRQNKLREIQWEKGKKIFVQNLFWYQGKVWVITTNQEMWCKEPSGWRKMAELPAFFHKVKVLEGRLWASSDQLMYEWVNQRWEVVRSVAVHDRLIDFTLLHSTMFCLVKNQIIQFPLDVATPHQRSTLLVKQPILTPFQNGDMVEIPFSLIDFRRQRGRVSFQVNQAPWVELDPKAAHVRLSALAPGEYQVKFRVDQTIREVQSFRVPTPWFKHPLTWVMALMIVFLLYYLYYQARLQRLAQANQLVVDKLHLENRLKESRIQLIKAQMNPHFFFNALNTIQSYIVTQENKQAEEYLQQFSRLTRMILDMTDKSVISLAEELAMQRTYLDLQCVRLKDFSYSIEVAPNLSEEDTFLPTMLLQPYVENALLHGLGHSLREKRLWIRFQRQENSLKIEIEDNGIGREKAAQIQRSSRRKHKSFATQASLERIALSNQDQWKIQIEDLPHPGTLVHIQLPYPYFHHESTAN